MSLDIGCRQTLFRNSSFNIMKKIILLLLVFCPFLYMKAEIKLPNVFGSNMVIQQGKPIVIWGQANPGEPVKVTLRSKTKSITADDSGRWKVTFPSEKATYKAFSISIQGENTIDLENVVVGEVWLASGQSNMEYEMKLRSNYKKPGTGEDLSVQELTLPENNKIRLFLVKRKKGITEDIQTNGWQVCDPESLAPFSAAAYYFGKELQQQLNVPVGLIAASWGGTRIEPWTPAWAYKSSPLFAAEATSDTVKIENAVAGELYEGMIRALVPFALKGFIWYQGESNAMFEDARYYDKQKLLVESWRKLWKNDQMPFYYVQIAPYYYSKRKDKIKHTSELLPWFWEIQTRCMNIPHSGMVVVTDLVDHLSDIHPSYKWEIGRRLALWPLAFEYGQKNLVYSGPKYKSMKITGNKILLDFDHKGGGLMCKGDSLTWFEIAGKDGKFFPAQAIIKNNRIEVSSGQIQSPQQVRFAWYETALPNFFNQEGLPALPFRTGK